jgi:segregation and condensation protein B
LKEKKQKMPEESEQEKLKHDLALVEAALYVAGRPLDLKALGSVIGTRSKRKIRKLARMLMEKYRNHETALEILELGDKRFVLQLKTEYTPKVQKLAIRPLISKGPLKTLSYVAYRQPVLQPNVIEVRGSHAYGHLKQLEDMELITREKAGRTKLLRTTKFFSDYFGLSHDTGAMKRQLKGIFEDFTETKPEEEQN